MPLVRRDSDLKAHLTCVMEEVAAGLHDDPVPALAVREQESDEQERMPTKRAISPALLSKDSDGDGVLVIHRTS